MKILTHILTAFDPHITRDEILDLIGDDMLAHIKMTDPEPVFKAFILCHDGTAIPNAHGVGAMEIEFTRDAISSMNDRRPGTLYFNDYHKGGQREKIGQEIAHIQKEIDGRLCDISIAYAHPERKKKFLEKDIVSFEAVWNLVKKAGRYVARKFERLEGIATGRRDDGIPPAFSGSGELLTVHAFADSEMIYASGENMSKEQKKLMLNKLKYELDADENYPPPPVQRTSRMSGKRYTIAGVEINPEDISFGELRDLVRQKKAHFTQIFDLESGEVFGERVTMPDGTVAMKGGDVRANEWLIKHEAEIRRGYDEKLKEFNNIQSQLNEIRAQNRGYQLRDQLTARAIEKKMSAPEMAILERMTDRFKPQIEQNGKSEEEIKNLENQAMDDFLENVRKEHQQYSQIYTGKNDSGFPFHPTPAGVGTGGNENENEFSDI